MSSGFNIKVDSKAVMRALDSLSIQDVPFITAYTLTLTGQDIKAAEYTTMQQVFDRPTRFTLNAFRLKPATKEDLTAVVDFKEGFGSVPAWRYPGPEVVGGPRSKKSHELALQRAGILKQDEFVVPGQGAVLDAYGNMNGGEITRILSQLKASPDPMQNASNGKRSKAKGQMVGSYFVLRGRSGKDGVYLRKGDRTIVPVMMFVRAPNYRPRFPFYEMATEVFNQRFMQNAHAAAWARTFAPKRRAA
jgi:hypothetical protein